MSSTRRALLGCLALAVTSAALQAQGPNGGGTEALGREVLREMIEVNTTALQGSTTVLAKKLAARFVAAGFPASDVQVVGPADTAQHHNLVVRWRGTGSGRPILLLAHLDVVEARREDWSFDPFTLTQRDGYYYGRGTMDVKGPGATLVTAMLSLRADGYTPARDIILALTSGEESYEAPNGVQWLIAHHREMIDAAYVINVDGGGGTRRGGRRTSLNVQAAEKVYQTFSLTARDRGGHSSVPTKANPIYRLARALERLDTFAFPTTLNPVTRAFFSSNAALVDPTTGAAMRRIAANPADESAAAVLSQDLVYNALLRTTCVATMLEGGHAENALPQLARATVNCRMMPGSNPDSVRATLMRVVADTSVKVEFTNPSVASPPTALTPDVEAAIRRVSTSLWGELPLLQTMETGATDGLFLRNIGIPVYGVSGVFGDAEDDRLHGRDERIGVASFREALVFMRRLVPELAGK